MTKVSIIICTYSLQRRQDTVEAVASVMGQDHQDKEVLLVVDRNRNLLGDMETLYADEPGVKVLFNTVPGLSAARNTGFRSSRGDIIGFLDDDALATEGWMTRIVKGYEDPRVVGVGGRIVPLWPGEPAWWIPEEMHWAIGCIYKGHPEGRAYVRNTFGSNITFKREVFREVGLFREDVGRVDDKMFTAEEMELCTRALARFRGSRILYLPDAVVQHRIYRGRQGLGYLVKRCYGDGLSKARVRSKKGNEGVLTTETGFLGHLLHSSIPGYLGEIVRFREPVRNSVRLAMLGVLTVSVLAGFAVGWCAGR